MVIHPSTIFKWNNRVVEVTATADKPVVFFKYLKDEDKKKCECGRSIDEEIVMVVTSPLFNEKATPVETLTHSTTKEKLNNL